MFSFPCIVSNKTTLSDNICITSRTIQRGFQMDQYVTYSVPLHWTEL